MLIALVASVPAFYDSMMPTPATWATWMYLVSGLVVLYSAWRAHQRARLGPALASDTMTWGHHPIQHKLDAFLGLALLANAVLPQSNNSEAALLWRLVIAVLMFYRLLRISKPLLTESGLGRLMIMGSTVLALCGIGFYWLDPEVTSIHDGLWLAFSTAATVGYGDVVPSTTASRIFSVFVVLLGYGLLSLVTASIAAMFVGSQERKVERDILRDMHVHMKALRQEISDLRLELRQIERLQPKSAPTDQDSAGQSAHTLDSPSRTDPGSADQTSPRAPAP